MAQSCTIYHSVCWVGFIGTSLALGVNLIDTVESDPGALGAQKLVVHSRPAGALSNFENKRMRLSQPDDETGCVGLRVLR